MSTRESWTLPAHRGAWDKGAYAWHTGKTEADCPYKGGPPFGGNRSFRNAWLDGYRTTAKENTDVV